MTPRMQQAVDAIRRLTVDGVSPSYSELAAELGLTTKSGAFRIVQLLRKRGLVTVTDGARRSIKLLEGPPRSDMEAWSDGEIRRVFLDLCAIGRARKISGVRQP